MFSHIKSDASGNLVNRYKEDDRIYLKELGLGDLALRHIHLLEINLLYVVTNGYNYITFAFTRW